MSRLIVFLCILGTTVSLTGCMHQRPSYTICLLDVSKSITPDGVQHEFKSADDLVDTMERGDRLTLIPITGNAISDTPGHILRLAVPTRRQPYDQDLVDFRVEAHQQIAAMHDAALLRPSIRTDIIGALDLAGEEFAADARSDRHIDRNQALIVLSDFIEDDGVNRFAFDSSLASDAGARTLADQLRKATCPALDGVRIRLGRLESIDLRSLTPQRQKAILAFWSRYLTRNKPARTASEEASHVAHCEEDSAAFHE